MYAVYQKVTCHPCSRHAETRDKYPNKYSMDLPSYEHEVGVYMEKYRKKLMIIPNTAAQLDLFVQKISTTGLCPGPKI